MRYYGSVYRPPSEARSLIVQVTYGCSHNTCAFCSMYKEKRFALRPLAEILEDFHTAREVYRYVEKVFLADGDALVRKASELYVILDGAGAVSGMPSGDLLRVAVQHTNPDGGGAADPAG